MLKLELIDEIYLTRRRIKAVLKDLKRIQLSLMIQYREVYKDYAYIKGLKKGILTDIDLINVELNHLKKFVNDDGSSYGIF